MTQIVAVRVRGGIGASQEVKDTLQSLNLGRQNYCTVLADTPKNQGMLKKAKDYLTWGEADEETLKQLVEKRGEESKGREQDSRGKLSYKRSLELNGKKLKRFFRLNPPQKGYGRKGVKKSFSEGGALGYRGEKINDLVRRML